MAAKNPQLSGAEPGIKKTGGALDSDVASGVSGANGANNGVGSRGPLKGPWWGSGGEAPEKI